MAKPLIDDKVRAFAEYLGCDPKLAQDIYFELEVSLSLDDENKEDLRRELEALNTVASKLAAARKTLENYPTIAMYSVLNWSLKGFSGSS